MATTRNEVAVLETRQVSGEGLPTTRAACGLGGSGLLSWGRLGMAGLERRRAEIDALNVFPVPDSDTGTNLLATMRAAVAEAERLPSIGDEAQVPAHSVAAALARGATAGARGNSGIILSQVLRGVAEATSETDLTDVTYRVALVRAAALVRGSLSDPVEGTVLTVLDRAGSAACACAESELAAVVCAGADAAAAALADTRDQLAVLRDAGVVDAGALGLSVLLDGFVTVVTGAAPARTEYWAPGPHRPPVQYTVAQRYEVMYRIAGAREDRVAELRSRLVGLGDSVVVAADGVGGVSVHVHCADAGAAVEAGLAVGELFGIRIEYLGEASASRNGVPPARSNPRTGGAVITGGSEAADTGQRHDRADRQISGRAREPADRGILTVASGAGIATLFAAGGAVVLHAEGALESAALLAAIRRLPHREVLVLPNGALPAHELAAVGAAARDTRRDVLLLPSASMVQGLSAVAVHDRARVAADDAFTMSEAAASTRWGALRRAQERALTMVGTCAPGDGLGLVGHDVVVIDRDPCAAGRTLLDRMLGLGGELVTLLVGADSPDGLADDLAGHIGAGFPGVEVTVYSGGQREDLIQIGVE